MEIHSIQSMTTPAVGTSGIASRADAPRFQDTLLPVEDSRGLAAEPGVSSEESSQLREAFQDFVGQTLFGSMLASMRKTVGKPAYLHGGRTEEVFQKQLDQLIVEDLSDASAATISDPMYELFMMQRKSG